MCAQGERRVLQSSEGQGLKSQQTDLLVPVTSDSLPHFVLSNHLQGQHTDLRGRADPGYLEGGWRYRGWWGGLSILMLFWDHYCRHLPGVSEADALAHPPSWPQRPSGHRDSHSERTGHLLSGWMCWGCTASPSPEGHFKPRPQACG